MEFELSITKRMSVETEVGRAIAWEQVLGEPSGGEASHPMMTADAANNKTTGTNRSSSCTFDISTSPSRIGCSTLRGALPPRQGSRALNDLVHLPVSLAHRRRDDPAAIEPPNIYLKQEDLFRREVHPSLDNVPVAGRDLALGVATEDFGDDEQL